MAKSPPVQPSPLPPYTVRKSLKSKLVRLQVSLERGVEVIIPKGFDPKQIPEILHRKRLWLERSLQRVEEQHQNALAQATDALPEQIVLSAIAQTWQVEYQPTASSRVTCRESPDHRLVLTGLVSDTATCKLVLQQWLIQKGRKHLVPWLQSVSKTSQLPFRKVTVRHQKSKWGSCTDQKNISLNCKLLLLPAPVVNYVLVHELCHTVHLNHSAQFWSLVGSHEANYQTLKKELRQVEREIPSWV
ncbi:MAG: SprT family zinc-dependent metalloprotease [Leptolyngbyaceae bacterium]|nr:SprT family zinc-dependent metalloprotease [Leptolyngbyaceae bacterium]